MTKITSLTAQTSAASSDNIPIVDNSGTPTTKKITWANLIKSIISQTKGNLPASDGSTIGALTVGSNNQVLTADSSQTYGIKWATPASGGQSGDMVYPLNVTIGDYASPVGATGSSISASDITYDFASSSGWTQVGTWIDINSIAAGKVAMNNGGNNAEHRVWKALGITLSDTLWTCYFDFIYTASATATFPLMFTSTSSAYTTSQDAIAINVDGGLMQMGALDGAGSFSAWSSTVSLNSSTQYYCTLARTSSTNIQLKVFSDSTRATQVGSTINYTINSTVQTLTHIQHTSFISGASATGNTWQTDNVKIWNGVSESTLLATNTFDTNVATRWTSASENNPNIYFDLTSARDIASIAIHLDRTNTTETQIKIRCSTDTTFTDGETVRLINVSDFTDDTWRFIPINRLSADCRYFQIYGVSNSVVLAINEVKVYYAPAVTDWNRKHFHKYLDPTSATANTLDSN